MKAYVSTHWYMNDQAALLIVKMWKQLRCPLSGEWIETIMYIHTVKYYSAIKSNEVLIVKRPIEFKASLKKKEIHLQTYIVKGRKTKV